ncbi:DUF222 domain-containing protein [Arthrobacter sp. 24S4-2]|uniref:HNH endonuclease signature motif containing protein n=1 Tax=Arthrobacter sp. 24S4-2 TaxID=2575374 RepID=UPI0010C7CF52|nr:HNH endonuclease signature motif containing protein [Arthrobacter sp. 24S4-2]QCO97141.1 DUF222 domain-containing protein [Arthrobacter sp. 24S4-2]
MESNAAPDRLAVPDAVVREVPDWLEAIAASVAVLARLCASAESADGPDANLLQLAADTSLQALEEVARLEGRTAEFKVRMASVYTEASRCIASPAVSRGDEAALEMGVVAEVACALTVSEGTAAAFLAESRTLTTTLPLTLAALRAGTLSWQHARIMCDETASLEPAAAAGLEAHFLDPEAPQAARGCPAGELVPGRFRAKARSWRERHHPVSIEIRHRKSARERRLEYTPDRDGMAWLSAYLPADAAAGVWSRATEAARALQGPSESRTLTQLRADVAAAWLLEGVAEGTPSPTAQVLVTVPVLSLLGSGTEPAELDSYGPIPASMARRLVGEGAGSFLRVLTDPRDGAPLEIGRTSYRVPKSMRQWLRLRDGRCPFPGCNNQSLDNEADHLLAWSEGGGTGITNLGQPCRRHHRLKHSTRWKPVDATLDKPPGWISPSGRYYRSEQQDWAPPDWEPTQWPDDPQGLDSQPPDGALPDRAIVPAA